MQLGIWRSDGCSGAVRDCQRIEQDESQKLHQTFGADGQQDKLYKSVAILTDSKNALKGVGFLRGGALLALIGFKGALLAVADILSKSRSICGTDVSVRRP
jgi:hypothetical protein